MTAPEAAVNTARQPFSPACGRAFRRVAVQGDKAKGEGVYTDVHDRARGRSQHSNAALMEALPQ